MIIQTQRDIIFLLPCLLEVWVGITSWNIGHNSIMSISCSPSSLPTATPPTGTSYNINKYKSQFQNLNLPVKPQDCGNSSSSSTKTSSSELEGPSSLSEMTIVETGAVSPHSEAEQKLYISQKVTLFVVNLEFEFSNFSVNKGKQ